MLALAGGQDPCVSADLEEEPFDSVLLPFVVWARSACHERAGRAHDRLNRSAHAAIAQHLLRTLVARAGPTLALELNLALRASGGDPLDFLLTARTDAGYWTFVRHLQDDDGFLDFFVEYAVLARVLVTITERWVDATVELLRRLDGDADSLGELTGDGPGFVIVGIKPSLSDPHRGRRTVAVLTTSSGARVVYKPRSLRSEAAWNGLLVWIAGCEAPPLPSPFVVVDRGDYGWAMFVDYEPCRGTAGARHYYRAAGALLALVHVLRGVDCHADNLIATATGPVLVDTETLMAPEPLVPPTGPDACRLASARIRASVLATYLLPARNVQAPGGTTFDGSGLGVQAAAEHALPAMAWLDVNTDRMRLAEVERSGTPPQRAATADGRALRVTDYENEVVAGFTSMCDFLVLNRDRLLDRDGPLAPFAGAESRYVHRDTRVYAAILQQLDDPNLLRHGIDRSIAIEQLASASLTAVVDDGRAGWQHVFEHERRAIEAGDVPYFCTGVLETSLPTGTQLVEGWFETSGFGGVLDRLRRLDATEVSFEVGVARSSIRSVRPRSQRSHVDEATSPESWIDLSLAIAGEIERAAFRGDDGSVAWLALGQPEPDDPTVVKRPEVVGPDLYHGGVGIALFLASVAAVTGENHFRESALGATIPTIDALHRNPRHLASTGVGGMVGLGSLVYGLTTVATITGDTELLEGAEVAATMIAGALHDHTPADVSIGMAGALLGLLALHGATGSTTALDTAIMCGTMLLARATPVHGAGLAIPTLAGRPQTGFAHGASGIAYALTKLYESTGDPRSIATARGLLLFERETYSPELGTWPDLRSTDPRRFGSSWCHGAPGIVLARLGCLPVLADDDLHDDIERGLTAVNRMGVLAVDELCCGTFGVVDILGMASRQLGRENLRDSAEQLARSALSQGGPVLSNASIGILSERSLFKGLAGIGLALLRLADHAPLPQPLLLDVGVLGAFREDLR